MLKYFSAMVAAIGLLVALCIGAYQLYWHVAKSNVSHRYDVNTGTQQYQSGLIAQERDLVVGWHAATDRGQKEDLGMQFCSIYQTLTSPPADLVAASSSICI